MLDAIAAQGGAELDPEIRRFIKIVGEAYAAHPKLDSVSPAQARVICEIVRAPWAEGGPPMADTAERFIASPTDPVRVRIYNPSSNDRLKPGFIYLHGGGWALFSIDTHDRLMREYAAAADVVVIGVDYALAPEARFPVALEQTVAVARWLREHGAEVGVDPTRLACGGDSAGGALTMGAALTLRDAGEGDVLKAMLLSYAGFDFECSAEDHARFGGAGYMLASDEVEVFWNNYISSPDDKSNPLARTALARLEGLPPVFMTIPECDVLTGQNLAMAKRFEAADVPVEAIVYKGATHSFLEAMAISHIARQAIADGARWLKATLVKAAT